MIYHTFYVNKTFEAGMVVGSVRSFLAGQNAGELHIEGELPDTMEVEVSCHNHFVMAWVETQLAPFVS